MLASSRCSPAAGARAPAAPRAAAAAAARAPRRAAPRARAVPSKEEALAQLEAFATTNAANIAAAEAKLREAGPGGARKAAAGAAPDGAAAAQGGLRELNQGDFWEFLESTADKLTVVDFYTDWCGPCKMIYPELVRLSQELGPRGGQVVKFNCNKDNKELGRTLGIKVAPTFHLYRGREKLGEMTGAKVEKLREMIEANL
ncbi:thioredoxin chloroplastic [Raphidocelis subcapitata]|uniref:Thioredoxin chloroplastic n=1 Tax=Raphidocelis subcapitata TaxID=307507 RepID=A0A2V0PAQ5_9CHLO|nr:thioredoxin chloroplastic [Raphidocelis subcapitata]|eukprot:GBF94247.1 thioredoxin chloroplastic [Raphidocelis subcapitata]